MSSVQGTTAVITTYADDPQKVAAFWRLRKRLFVDKLGWDLRTTGELEVDEFDAPHTEYCIVSHLGSVVGGFRAIRTDYDYLAFCVFPQLATLRPYPRRRDMWEISRFGILADAQCHDLALLNYSLMFQFAKSRRAAGLVALADVVYERFLRTLGIRTRRYGPCQKIGVDASGRDLVCLVGEIPIAEQTPDRLSEILKLSNEMEVRDGVVRGSEAIPA